MKAAVHQHIEVTLVMNQDEAEWLRDFVQNYPGDPTDELPAHAAIRRTLFDTLTVQLNPEERE